MWRGILRQQQLVVGAEEQRQPLQRQPEQWQRQQQQRQQHEQRGVSSGCSCHPCRCAVRLQITYFCFRGRVIVRLAGMNGQILAGNPVLHAAFFDVHGSMLWAIRQHVSCQQACMAAPDIPAQTKMRGVRHHAVIAVNHALHTLQQGQFRK